MKKDTLALSFKGKAGEMNARFYSLVNTGIQIVEA